MNVVNQIKELLGMEVKLAQMKLQDGVTVIEADAFEAGNSVFIVNGMDKVPVPVGEYELEDGTILVVEVEGIIYEITEQAAEEAMPETNHPAAEAAEPQVEASNETTEPKKVIESITKEMFFSEIEKLRAEIAELKLSKTEVVEAVELSNNNVEVLSHNPEATNEIKMNLYSQKRGTTTFDVVLSKLNK